MIINTLEYNFYIKQSDRLQIHFDYEIINEFYFYNFLIDNRYKFLFLVKPDINSKPKLIVKNKIYSIGLNNILNNSYFETLYVINQLAEIVGDSLVDNKILENKYLNIVNKIPTNFNTLKFLYNNNLKVKLTKNFIYRNFGTDNYTKLFNEEFFKYFEVVDDK